MGTWKRPWVHRESLDHLGTDSIPAKLLPPSVYESPGERRSLDVRFPVELVAAHGAKKPIAIDGVGADSSKA